MQFSFNAAQYEPNEGGTGGKVYPAGWYPGVIRKSNWMPVKDKPSSAYLALEIEITPPSFAAGETYVARLNLFHESAQTVEIANKTLTAICYACGQGGVNGTEQKDMAVAALHNIPFMFELTLQRDGGGNNLGKMANGQGTTIGKKPVQLTAADLAQPGAPVGGAVPGGFAPPAQPQGFGAPQPGPGVAPGQAWQQPGGAAPAPAQPGFGAPPAAAPGGFGQPPQQPGFGAPPAGAPAPFGAPPAGYGQPQGQPSAQAPQGFAQPAAQPGAGFGAPPAGFGGAPQGAPQGGFGAPPANPAAGAAPWGAPAGQAPGAPTGWPPR